MPKTFKKGFTLIELLVVIGILAVLLAITLIAINPAKQFSQSNNTKRQSDVLAILNGVYQYAADNKGAVPVGITGVAQAVSNTGADLCAALIPTYLAALPVDPLTNNGGGNGAAVSTCSGAYTTNYTIVKNAAPNNRITVAAPAAELGQVISVTR